MAEHHILETRTCFAYYEYVSRDGSAGLDRTSSPRHNPKAAITSASVRP
jgi:hypothetical protein